VVSGENFLPTVPRDNAWRNWRVFLGHSAHFTGFKGQDVVVDCVERGIKDFKETSTLLAGLETKAVGLENPKKDRKGS